MLDSKTINQISEQIKEILPPAFKDLKTGFEESLQDVLQSSLTKLNVITREEFDIQTKVLARTRAKLDDLEAKLAELEGKSKY